MTTLSEYPGEEMPYWAVTVWYRCKFCKLCYEFEEQLIKHKNLKHQMVTLPNEVNYDETDSSGESNICDDDESVSSTSTVSTIPIPPVIVDVSESLADGCERSMDSEHLQLDDLSDTDDVEIPSENVDELEDFSINQEDLVTGTEDSSPSNNIDKVNDCRSMRSTHKLGKPGCEMSDKEIEISNSSPVKQLKHESINKKIAVCTICKKECKSNAGLKSHMNASHRMSSGPNEIYNCPFCRRKFSSQVIKERHVQNCCHVFNKRKKSSKRLGSALYKVKKGKSIPKTIK